jgi:hypothetical protein
VRQSEMGFGGLRSENRDDGVRGQPGAC